MKTKTRAVTRVFDAFDIRLLSNRTLSRRADRLWCDHRLEAQHSLLRISVRGNCNRFVLNFRLAVAVELLLIDGADAAALRDPGCLKPSAERDDRRRGLLAQCGGIDRKSGAERLAQVVEKLALNVRRLIVEADDEAAARQRRRG